MRIVVALLFMMVCATMLSETEAGWWRRAKDWAKEHVRVQVRYQHQFKRSDDVSSPGCTAEELLQRYGCSVEVSEDQTAAHKDDSDANDDGTLDEQEAKKYELLLLTELLEECLKQVDQAEGGAE
ncbi:uncharacterized protein LOC143298785 [Babylonia areolata]|uniref:uncharacterized protein LOC143298785 n=1 Tax=Babylonia areolata TaxID=304850 RepID=UPI003FD61BA6